MYASIWVSAIALRLSSEQWPASASSCVGVLPDCCSMVVIIGISCFLSLVSCVTALANDQLQLVDRHLHVVRLDESVRALHDPRLKQKHGERPGPCPRGPLPQNATIIDRMARKLLTKTGAAVYSARKGIVEPVIGQIKQAPWLSAIPVAGIREGAR